MPYLTPDALPEDDDCRPLSIPASSAWLAIVSGALTELCKEYNWERFGAVTVEQAVERMQEMIDTYYTGDCNTCAQPSGDAILRVGENGDVEQLVDGQWVAPVGDYAIPEPSARTESTSEERRCLAAANAENVLKLMYEEITDYYGSALGVLEAIAEFAILAGTLLAPGVGLTVRALGTIALYIWEQAFNTVEFVTADFWTEAFSENFRCALYRCASDNAGVVTFDFDCVNSELINQIQWIDPTLGSYTLAAQVRWLLSQIGSQGLDLAGATTAITAADCDECDNAWCYVWDLSVDYGNWSNYPGQPGSVGAEGWETGLAFAESNPTRGRRQSILQFTSFPVDAAVTAIEFEYEATLGNTSTGTPVAIYLNNFNVLLAAGTTTAGEHSATWGGGQLSSIATIELFLAVGGCDGCGDPGGAGVTKMIRVRGNGELPSEFVGGTEC